MLKTRIQKTRYSLFVYLPKQITKADGWKHKDEVIWIHLKHNLWLLTKPQPDLLKDIELLVTLYQFKLSQDLLPPKEEKKEEETKKVENSGEGK